MQPNPIYQSAPDYCAPYFDLVETTDLIAELKKSKQLTLEVLDLVTAENENYAYQPGKWTVKEVIKHIIDCERIYDYRAFRFSRFDAAELAGFDENKYAEHVRPIRQTVDELKQEYLSVRESTVQLYKFMTDEMLDFKGTANNANFTARAIGLMTVGHNIHHCNFLKKNYFKI